MTWLPSSSSPRPYARIQGFTEGTRAAGGAKGILTRQSQTISHYLPNICFYKILQEHSFPSFSSLTHPGAGCSKSVRSPSPESKPFRGVGMDQCPPCRVSATGLSPPPAVKSKGKPRTHQPALPRPPPQPAEERGLLLGGSPTAVRLWKLCRLRLWNSSTGLLQLIIPAAWIPNLGL